MPPPRIVLCIPGAWASQADLIDKIHLGTVERNGVWKDETGQRIAKLDFRGRDARMSDAFRVNALPMNSTLTPGDVAAVAQHGSVTYALSESVLPETAIATARQMLRVGRALLDAGGVAIKCESSGIGHSRSGWTRLAEATEASSDAACLTTLYSVFVAAPIRDGDDLYSCGMHLLGYPDAIALVDDDTKGAYLLNSFLVYLLQESRARAIASGHTFRPSEESPRYRIHHEPCRLYEPDRFLFNPYGMWRLSPAS
jgi:hypothetical protein